MIQHSRIHKDFKLSQWIQTMRDFLVLRLGLALCVLLAFVHVPVHAANKAPTVSLTSPITGASYTTQQTIPLSATAADSDGAIASVAFYAGGQILASVTSAPYTYSWTGALAGSYSITAKATDNLGAATTSSAATVTVTKAPSAAATTSPAAGSDVSGSAVDVIGTFGGDSQSVISVFNGVNSTVLATQTSPTTYKAANVPLAPGSNTLTTTVLQRDGTFSTSSVTVTNPVLQVVVTSPLKTATYNGAPTSLTLQSSAQTVPGTVQRVEYRLLSTGALIGTATSPPYSYVWNNPPNQTFGVFARVIDNAGRQADSRSIPVTILPPNQPPVVSLTAPTNGAVFQAPANLSLQATASDPDGSISLVEFLSNGNLLGASNTPPYAFALSAQPAGSYSFSARATDDKGAKTTSAPVAVTVDSNAPPSVSLTGPAAGTSYLAPANVQVSANAAAAVGSIAKVDFTATRTGGSTEMATATSAPFGATLALTQSGTYTLTATAYDSNGVSATSNPITVSVSDGVTYLHNDFAGSPIAATDSTGAVVWKENYQPYGSRNVIAPAEAGNRISFHGKPLDQETGLSYFGARYYDSAIGRFMGVDPVDFKEGNIHSFNRYTYANNNPYKYVDRDGRYAELAVEMLSLSVGYMSLRENMRAGNTVAATTDGLGMLADIVGAALPGVPGVAGLGIRASREAAFEGRTLYHYTDAAGAKGIAESGVVRADANGKVWLTDQKLTPDQVKDRLFTGRSGEKGSHVVEIQAADGIAIRQGKNRNELIHQGSVRNGRQGTFTVKPNDH